MGKAGQGIRKAGQFYLQNSLFSLCPLSENADDYFLTVKTGNSGKFFPVSLLARLKVKIKNNTVCLNLFGKFSNFFCLSLADSISRMHFHTA